MEGVYKPALAAQILFALVQNRAVNEHQAASFYGTDFPLPLDASGFKAIAFALWETFKLGAAALCSYEPLLNGVGRMASWLEAETTVLQSCILHSVPKANGAWRISIKKCRVLVRRNSAANFWLLADNHGLEHFGLLDLYGPSNLSVPWCHCDV